MNWNGKKVLVTGAGGFIASHLTERLIELGAAVTAMVRQKADGSLGNLSFLPPPLFKDLNYVQGDLQDAAFVGRLVKEAEIVFHLGALITIPYSYSNPEAYVRTNIGGTLNILEAVRQHGIERLIHTSTSECYGSAQFSPMTESHPLVAQSPYAATKIAADKLVESFYHCFQLPVTTLRPFNTYGPRQSRRAVVPNIICQVLQSEVIQLGDLSPVRDFLNVRDTVAAFLCMAESPQVLGKTIHVGSGEGVSIGEVVQKIFALVGKARQIAQAEKYLRPPTSEVSRLVCDASFASEQLGWAPQVSLEAGLKTALSFYEKNLDRYPNSYA